MHPALKSIAHRPWALPEGPWVMAQIWHDLLFAHWQIAYNEIRKLVPASLALDTFHGQCWIAVTPFHMSGVRARGLPVLPGLSRFPELNVRTYVTLDNKPGVFFFSLDAANLPAVFAARTFYRLPYFHAEMSVEVKPGSVSYHSHRRRGEAEFRGVYHPVGEVQMRRHGTLEHWLTERYCLYAVANGRVYRGEIHHDQWPLQDAGADIETNTMAAAGGIALPNSKPLMHFSRRLDVLVWPLRRVR